MGSVLSTRRAVAAAPDILCHLGHAEPKLLLHQVPDPLLAPSQHTVPQIEHPQEKTPHQRSLKVASCPPLLIARQEQKEEPGQPLQRRGVPAHHPLTPHRAHQIPSSQGVPLSIFRMRCDACG
jgi:hypothetical protein